MWPDHSFLHPEENWTRPVFDEKQSALKSQFALEDDA